MVRLTKIHIIVLHATNQLGCGGSNVHMFETYDIFADIK